MSTLCTVNLQQDEAQQFGVDWEGPNVEGNDDDAVSIPDTPCPLDLTEYEELTRLVPALSESTNYGIDLYLKTLDYVTETCHHDIIMQILAIHAYTHII